MKINKIVENLVTKNPEIRKNPDKSHPKFLARVKLRVKEPGDTLCKKVASSSWRFGMNQEPL